jgi:casein kinase 1
MDAMRRQVPPPAINAGSLAKQKSPIRHDQSTSKDAIVSFFLLLPEKYVLST